MESTREARRRKLMGHESERLAFITGQSRSLTPSCSFNSLCPPMIVIEQQQGEDKYPRSTTADIVDDDDGTGMEAHQHHDQTFSGAVEEDEKTDVLLCRHETSSEFAKCRMGKRFEKGEMRKQAAGNAEQHGSKIGPVARESSDQAVDGASCVNLAMSRQALTSSQISEAISASENIRLACAVATALLVVMSTHGLGSTLSLRPLFLVLLTDATIILGQLLLGRKGRIKQGEEARRTGQEEFDFANNIGYALDVGLAVQKALNAAIMDCTICAVIMISGLFI